MTANTDVLVSVSSLRLHHQEVIGVLERLQGIHERATDAGRDKLAEDVLSAMEELDGGVREWLENTICFAEV
jgi:hypothetical protein